MNHERIISHQQSLNEVFLEESWQSILNMRHPFLDTPLPQLSFVSSGDNKK